MEIDPNQQTGRTTKLLIQMLASDNRKNYYISPTQEMAMYHFEMFLDILFKLSIPYTTRPNRYTVEVNNQEFKFVGKDFVENKGFKEQPHHFFDHTCIGL